MFINKLLNIHIFNKILLFLVLGSIIFSFYLEYYLNIIPCKLCTIQRYLWITLLLVCVLNLILPKPHINFLLTSILLGSIALLSFYHSGIEHGMFKNIISCAPIKNSTGNSIEELDKIIRNTKNLDCAFPKFLLFQLSLSNLSFLLSTILFLFNLKINKKNLNVKYASQEKN